GSAIMFVNAPGMLIVLGGTLATCFIKFSMKDVINSFKVAMKAFMFKMEPPDQIINKMVSMAKVAKKDGLIALEKQKVSDKFAAKALRYLADGLEEGLIEDMLNKDIRYTVQRHATGQKLFKGMGASAPAFGMIGTLIGLVQMLATMSDPASIGPSMAVALLTTLYGALVANLVCLPLADKLAMRSQQEQETKNIILEATVGIHRGLSPMIIQDSLKVYISPKERSKVAEKKGKKKK
ncbi:MAG: MotA/TolQ/ExbB proton channel family protein, partial [Thermodesulfobacteriota bacterium]|nr:MotA/TolQ/ExbB proton channel family protein [Thermodesulfobacteriota bacterium]